MGPSWRLVGLQTGGCWGPSREAGGVPQSGSGSPSLQRKAGGPQRETDDQTAGSLMAEVGELVGPQLTS